MTAIALPIYTPSRESTHTVDRSRPYASCEWLEQGIAFNRRSINACLIVHHGGRGFPHLCDYNGGPVDVAAVLDARARVILANQNGGHDACRGCPHLVTRRWPKPRHPIRLIAIAQFARCNIECSYCYLQTQDPSVYAAGYTPYEVLPAMRELLAGGMVAARPTVDWGGGEPTVYPEFDAVLELVTRRGGLTWVHTNGTRLPAPIRDGLPTKRIHILCSVDAGTRETWRRMKGRDLLETVWRNLEQYVRLGCRVMLKYIMTEENCAPSELKAFIDRAAAIGARELVLDIDYDHPHPSERVLAGLRMLRRLAAARGIHATFGSTGANYTPEVDVNGRLADRDGVLLRAQRAAALLAQRFRAARRRIRRR